MEASLEQLAEAANRDAAERILSRLLDRKTSTALRDDLVVALGEIADPRLTTKLFNAGLDPSLSPEIRDAAFDVLASSSMGPTDSSLLRQWWQSDDDVLRRWALLFAWRSEGDLIAQIADDPGHPFYKQAIETIGFEFDEPEWQERKVTALHHPDAEVRAIAADILQWDEPLVAQDDLIAATADTSEQVRLAAMRTLENYFSRKVVEHAAHLLETAPIHPQAEALFLRLRHEFVEAARATAYSTAVRDQLRRWMQPVASIFDIDDSDIRSMNTDGDSLVQNTSDQPSLETLIAALSQPGGTWAGKLLMLAQYDWTAVPEDKRRKTAQFLQTHPDAQVRMAACRALAEWHDSGRLVGLLEDPVRVVRKAALGWLYVLPADPQVARHALALLESGQIGGGYATEAIATYSAHAPKAESQERLLAFLKEDRRENVRTAAVQQLGEQRLQEMLFVLDEDPLVTWTTHEAVLALCENAGLRPASVERFRNVDDLWMASLFASLEPFRD
jgi:HEAT repeat protein